MELTVLSGSPELWWTVWVFRWRMVTATWLSASSHWRGVLPKALQFFGEPGNWSGGAELKVTVS